MEIADFTFRRKLSTKSTLKDIYLISSLKSCLLFLQMFNLRLNVFILDFIKTFVFPAALVAATGSGGVRGEDASGVDVEHPCGGSAVVERPTAVTVQSTVKAEHVSRLLTRALHRVADIKQTYVSIQHTLVSFCRAEFPVRSVAIHSDVTSPLLSLMTRTCIFSGISIAALLLLYIRHILWRHLGGLKTCGYLIHIIYEMKYNI